MSEADVHDAQRWRALLDLDQMRDHWYWRPGMREGRSFSTWHLTFEDATEVHRLAAFYQTRLPPRFLDPVPAQWLHLTMQGVGFADEVPDDDLARIAQAARRRCHDLPAFTLRVGPADADPEGVPLALRPWEPILAVRSAVRAAIAGVWGAERVPEPADGFHPHITVAYSNAVADPTPLREVVTELRDTPPVETIVTSANLIRLSRDTRLYRWETVARVRLGH